MLGSLHEVDVNVPQPNANPLPNDGDLRRFVLGAIQRLLADYTTQARPAPPNKPTNLKFELARIASHPLDRARDSARPSPRTPISSHRCYGPRFSSCSGAPPYTPLVTFGRYSAGCRNYHPPPRATRPEWRLIRVAQKTLRPLRQSRGLIMLHIRHADQRVRFGNNQASYHTENISSQRLLI